MAGEQGTSYLSIPQRMSRSISHESFATDVSLMSLSSFTSEIPSSKHHHREPVVESEWTELNETELRDARFREEVLGRMLESHALARPPPHLRSRQGSNASHQKKLLGEEGLKNGASASKEGVGVGSRAESEEDLLSCAAEERPRGSLYKSFSTTDLVFLPQNGVKHCASQAVIPPDYAQAMQCRRRHLEDIQRVGVTSADLLGQDLDFFAFPPDPSLTTPLRRVQRKLVKANSDFSGLDPRTSTSEENIPSLSCRSTGPIMRRLKISKEIGQKIRDDLVKKIGKQKERLTTRLDVEREKGKPVTKLDRNFMIFHWLQSLDEDSFDEASA